MIKRALLALIFCLVAPYLSGALFPGACFAQTRTEKYEKLMGEAEKAQEKPSGPKILRPVVNYQSQEYRDPFQKYQDEERARDGGPARTEEDASSIAASMQIQGIIWGGRFPQAIVNNKVVKVGDSVGETRIIEIKKDGITVLINNRNYTIPAPASGAVPSPKGQKGGQ